MQELLSFKSSQVECSNFRAESAPPRSYSEQSSPQVSAPPSPRPQQTQQQRRPVIDDDMGIVPTYESG
ncbi:hypothetical protein Aduo_003395 [Ancylostoma duodenale]